MDISGLTPGQYFVRLRTNEFVETRKLMVLRN
ncbi:MAG: T9SS type A sorting domain-containing protein [Flavobacteriales bacterium]|nr:T9SS type A sorting domain-containing protein [Flavobacteriales bacterium]